MVQAARATEAEFPDGIGPAALSRRAQFRPKHIRLPEAAHLNPVNKDRLDQLWSALRMPPAQQEAILIKYSKPHLIGQLNEVGTGVLCCYD
jgi:hypothetical protein